MVVESSFLLSRSTSTNQVEGSTLPARVPQPRGSRQFCRTGSRQPARAKRKTRTENKRGAGRRECKSERMQKRRQRSREQRARQRGNHSAGPQNPLRFSFSFCVPKRCHSVCSFLGKPTCGELNHHTRRHARVCQGGYEHRR